MNIKDIPAVLTGDATVQDFGSYLRAHEAAVRRRDAWTWKSVSGLLIVLVCTWSLSEAWIEVDVSNLGEVYAIVVAKLIWIGSGCLAMSGKRSWRGVFAFLCCVSVLAVGSALPSVFSISRAIFVLLFAECALKALCLVALLRNRFAPAASA